MKAERAAAAAKAEARREKNGGTAPRGGKHDDADEEPRAPGDTRPRKNRAKIAAKKATEEAAKSERRGLYDLSADDLLAPRPSVDKVRNDLRAMRKGGGGGGGRGRGGFGGGGRGGGGRGRGRGRGR